MWKDIFQKIVSIFCPKMGQPTILEDQFTEMPPDLNVIKIENKIIYKPGKILCSQGITEVSQGFSLEGKLIIVKKFKLPKDQDIQAICNILKRLIKATESWEHPNLVKYIGSEYLIETGEFIIFTESVPSDYDSMIKIIKEEPHIKFLIYQIFKAVKFLYDNGLRKIGNIKPSNLLWESNGIIKIRDYIGNEYFKTLRKIQGVPQESSKENFKMNEDLLDIKRLIMNIGYRIKLSCECLSFIKLLEQLSLKSTIDFNAIFSHPFMQIEVNREAMSEYSHREGLLSNNQLGQIKKKNSDNWIKKIEMESFNENPVFKKNDDENSHNLFEERAIKLWNNASEVEIKHKNDNFEQKNDNWADGSLRRGKSQVLPAKKNSSSIHKEMNSSQDSQIKKLLTRQQNLIAKMLSDAKSTHFDRGVQDVSQEVSLRSVDTKNPRSEFSYNELLNILNEQNQYIQFLEKKFNGNNPASGKKTTAKAKKPHVKVKSKSKRTENSIINNNIIITNIGQQFNSRHFRSFAKKKHANDCTIDENDSIENGENSKVGEDDEKNISQGASVFREKIGSDNQEKTDNVENESSQKNSKSLQNESNFSISEKNFPRKIIHL